MAMPLMKLVLPHLAEQLQCQLERYHSGAVNEEEFAHDFAALLKGQYDLLSDQGVSQREAALTIHAAVLVLSRPGLRAEAEERNLPLELVECEALRSAANYLSSNYALKERWVFSRLGDIVAEYWE